jgi:photosystem II stability/assembly factor-like uncharacterized protein
MYTIDFVNSRLGHMGGTDGALYRSVDGGANWTSISPPNGFKYAYDISSLDFISADTGFAVGFLGRIMKTTDSGQTWVSYSPTYSGISSVTFGSPSTGYATNGSYILKTTDTGRTWNTLGLSTGTDFGSSSAFKYAHFTSADTGYVISNHYVEVHKTSDGGQSWTTLNPAGAGYEDVPGVSYPDPKTDILSLGTLLVETKDGGNSWNSLWSAQYSNQYFANIFYVNATTAYATSFSTNQLYKTTDGFQTWNLVFTNSLGYSITGIWFVNPQKGFITDDETEIFMTNDGGNTWQSVPFAESFIYDTFNSTIRFFNEQVGYLTNGNIFGPGSYGRIYKTVDGGQSWQLSYKIGGSSISFTPDSNVVIAGFGGTILKSPIKGWQIDSFTVNTNNSCGEILSASIGAALSEVDSIQFVITGPGGSTSLISTNPVLIKNNRATCVSVINDLTPDSTYSARVKFLYNGTYVYSNPLNFVARGFPAPYIYDSAGVLLSSSPFGNQWYLNGTAISGASQQQWAAKTSGNYTVQVTQDNCTSPMSIPLKFIANNLGIIIYPNPSKDYFYIMNTQNRTLSINIRDITGRLVTSHSLNYSGTAINVNKLSQGEYIVNIWDEKSHQTTNILFLKL